LVPTDQPIGAWQFVEKNRTSRKGAGTENCPDIRPQGVRNLAHTRAAAKQVPKAVHTARCPRRLQRNDEVVNGFPERAPRARDRNPARRSSAVMSAAASGLCLPQGDKSYLATREEAHRQTGSAGAIARVADHPATPPQPPGMPPAESAVREDGRAAGQTH